MGGEGGEGGEGGVGGGGLGTHWQPLNTSLITRTKGRGTRWGQWQRSEGGEQWSSGVDKALRAVGAVRAVWAEGVWAHIGSLSIYFIKTYTTRTKGRRR